MGSKGGVDVSSSNVTLMNLKIVSRVGVGSVHLNKTRMELVGPVPLKHYNYGRPDEVQ